MRTESTPLGQVRRGLQRAVLGGAPLQVAGGRLALRHPQLSPRRRRTTTSRTYYAPNNLTGVLVGDFKAAEVQAAARALLRPHPARQDGAAASGDARAEAASRRSASTPRPRPRRPCASGGTASPSCTRTAPRSTSLSDVLSGRTGPPLQGARARAARSRTRSPPPWTSRSTRASSRSSAWSRTARTRRRWSRRVYEEIEKLQKEPVPAEELQKVKNQAKANAYRRLSSPFFIAIQLLVYDGLGDWRYINTYAEEVDARHRGRPAARGQAVPDQGEPRRWASSCARRAPRRPRTPRSRPLPAQAQAMVRQSLQQIEAETDPAKLREGIAQMQQMAGPGAAGDEAGARAPPEAGAGAPGRPGEREEVSTRSRRPRLRRPRSPLAAATLAAPALAPGHPRPPGQARRSSRSRSTPPAAGTTAWC